MSFVPFVVNPLILDKLRSFRRESTTAFRPPPIWAWLLALIALAGVGLAEWSSQPADFLPTERLADSGLHDYAESSLARLAWLRLSGADPGARRRTLAALDRLAAKHGLIQVVGPVAGQRLAAALDEHRPALIPLTTWPRLRQLLADEEAVVAQLRRHLAAMDRGAAWARAADPLDCDAALWGSWRELATQDAGALRVWSLPWSPAELDRSRAWQAALDELQRTSTCRIELSSAALTRLQAVDRLRQALLVSLPLSLLAVVLVLRLGLGSWRALIDALLPALVALPVALAITALAGGGRLILLAVAVLPLLAGLAVDYGIHASWAGRRGHRLQTTLATCALTSVAAALPLIWSALPVLQQMGFLLVVGLGLAGFLSRRGLVDAPEVVANALADQPTPRWWLPLVVLLLTLPGLALLRWEHSASALSGRSATEATAETALRQSLGLPSDQALLQVTGPDLRSAQNRLAAALAASQPATTALAPIWLPDAATAAARHAAWDRFWRDQGPRWRELLPRAARRAGVSPLILSASLRHYRPQPAPTEPTTAALAQLPWITALAGRRLDSGDWQLVHLDASSRLAAAAELPGCRLIAPERAGRLALEATRAAWLSALPLALLLAVAVLRWRLGSAWRRIATVALVPLASLALVGLGFGLAGQAIGAIELTAALVILGVGLDDALFFGACPRRAVLRPACTTSLASLAGLVGLLASDHPLLQRFALALALGIVVATLLAVFSHRADGRGQLPHNG